jgi:hypothetical protein
MKYISFKVIKKYNRCHGILTQTSISNKNVCSFFIIVDCNFKIILYDIAILFNNLDSKSSKYNLNFIENFKVFENIYSKNKQ